MEVEYTAEFGARWDDLPSDAQERVTAAGDLLEQHGPLLGRPLVDTLRGSRHPNMKELRPGNLRVLFAFDPRRTAILLLTGDESGRWQEWYAEAIPEADRLYDEHLESLLKEVLIDGT